MGSFAKVTGQRAAGSSRSARGGMKLALKSVSAFGDDLSANACATCATVYAKRL
jgi:hypothetical protein